MHQCVICGCGSYSIVFNESGIDILKCKNCGHVFSSYSVDQNYDGYFGKEIKKEDHFWWDKAHEKMNNDFCKKFIKGRGGKLLDVGCGLGYFIKFVSTFPKWEATGCEISGPAVDYANNNLNLKNVFRGRVEELKFSQNYFNIITLWDVIEHIPNPESLLTYLASILGENGILFIHTPNINIQLPKARIKKLLYGEKEDGHYLEAKDHVNIYSSRAIRKLLNKYGFKNIEFAHFHPIQSVAGSKSEFKKLIKNLWFYFSVFLFKVTFGKVNLDNLFVIAKR